MADTDTIADVIADDGHTHETACLNCATPLSGAYCSACGQHAHLHRTIGAFFHDLLHGVLHLDGKVWRTLPLLVLHPGELTRRYIHGERAKFVSPVALFLFAMFLMYAIVGSLGPLDPPPLEPGQGEQLSRSLEHRQRVVEGELAHADQERAAAVASRRDTAELDEHREDIQLRLRGIQNARDEVAAGRTPRFVDLRTGWPRLDHGLAKASANPNLLAYKLQTSAYKYSWALIVLSVPFVALLFVFKRGVSLYDHTVFVTYSMVFMTFLTVTFSLLAAVGMPWSVLELPALLIPPVHLFLQVRGTYRLTIWGALWRTAAIFVFAMVTITLFLLILLGMGLLG